MQDAFGIVILVVVGISVVLAVVSLFFARPAPTSRSAAAGSATTARAAPRLRAGGRSTSASATTRSARCSAARNERRAARGEAPLDVEAELRA